MQLIMFENIFYELKKINSDKFAKKKPEYFSF